MSSHAAGPERAVEGKAGRAAQRAAGPHPGPDDGPEAGRGSLAGDRVPGSRLKRALASFRFGPGELWALGSALAYAVYQVLLRVAVQGGDLNVYVGGTVQALPTLLLCLAAGWAIGRRSRSAASPLSDWRLIGSLFLTGLLVFVIGTPLVFAALRKGGVLIASPVGGTQVLWAALLAALLLREPLTRSMTLCLFISLVGVGVLSWAQAGGASLAPDWWLAVPYALVAAVCFAVTGVLLAYNLRRGVDRHQALGISTLVGLAAINGWLLVSGDLDLYAALSGTAWRGLAGAGLLGTAALLSGTAALALTSVASAATLGSLQIALAPIIAALFLKEDLNPAAGLGVLLVLAGVLGLQRARARLAGA